MRRWTDIEHTGGTRRAELRRERRWIGHRVPVLLVALVGILALLGMAPGALRNASAAGQTRGDTGTFDIIVPNPSSSTGSAQGPVGTNITVTGSGLTAGDTYQVGYATKDSGGCSSGIQPLGVPAIATDTSGNFAATFAWPPSLPNVGTSYYICLEDAASSVVQSQSTFTVDGNSPPTISIKAASASSSGYSPGGEVEIDGSYFLPGGTSLAAYLSASPIQHVSDLSNATQLSPVQGQSITSDGNGQVTVVVRIPPTVAPGNYYVYLVSTDSQADALPSLMNNVGIAIATAPTPTATVPAATPTATASTNTNTTPPGNNGGSNKALTVLGLAGLSFVLFVIGLILLVTASNMPRQA